MSELIKIFFKNNAVITTPTREQTRAARYRRKAIQGREKYIKDLHITWKKAHQTVGSVHYDQSSVAHRATLNVMSKKGHVWVYNCKNVDLDEFLDWCTHREIEFSQYPFALTERYYYPILTEEQKFELKMTWL